MANSGASATVNFASSVSVDIPSYSAAVTATPPKLPYNELVSDIASLSISSTSDVLPTKTLDTSPSKTTSEALDPHLTVNSNKKHERSSSPKQQNRKKSSSSSSNHRCSILVADTAAFIKNAPLHALAERVVTIPEVVEEIRDEQARQRLDTAPYELEIRQPSPAAMKTITSFAKQTGDIRVLSATDMKVLALAYMLDVEAHRGSSHLNTEPKKVSNVIYVSSLTL